MSRLSFPCSGCGACCRRINVAVEALALMPPNPELQFPYGWDAAGQCEKFEDGRCKVYEERPLVCRVEELAEYLKLEKLEFYRDTARICNAFMDEDQLPETLRVTI